MAFYRPDQRQVSAKIFTPIGWLSGSLHVGRSNTLLESVNAMKTFIKLTDVELSETGKKMPFLALQRNTVQLIVPEESTDRLEIFQSTDAVPKDVVCLLEAGVVKGTVRLLPDIRVSDFMAKSTGFFALRDCSSAIWQTNEGSASQAVPSVLINALRIVGVSEA